MAVILITGQPGGGKTALCVDMLAHDSQFEGRPIFVMGIPELQLEHTPCPPVAEWTEFRQSPEDETINLAYFTFPENALVVIDEAQRVYRPRPVGSKVPPEVAAFETHRHTGVDFILLTQHAGLLDSNIRKLIGRHIHIRVTPLGRYKYEWTELGDPESASSRDIAAKEKYKLPARAFDLYKSSQKHTKIKVKMPWFVYLFGIAAVSALVLGYYAYSRVTDRTKPQSAQSTPSHNQPGTKADSSKPEQLTANDYVESLQPRIPGMHSTAPRYDELTKPNDAPWPMGCVISAKWRDRPETCRCIDQQGNRYTAPDSLCRSIVQNGIFKDWQGPENERKQHEQTRQAAQPTGGAVSAAPALASAPSNPHPAFPGMIGAVQPAQPSAPAQPAPQNIPTVASDSPWRFQG